MIVPVLEVGGTHVTAAAVDTDGWRVPAEPIRLELDPRAQADELIATMLSAAATVDVPSGAGWGVAMPDPFDYETGVALFEGVGKFESLYGIDLGTRLGSALDAPLRFVNDADAFTLGEWAHGAAGETGRCCGLTLGTGVGSGWLVDGHVVDPGVPSGGRAHHLLVDGRPLEDVMSRRAIRRAYAERTGSDADVREIADRARAGEAAAVEILADALTTLGSVFGPAVTAFGAEVLVVGGSMAASWDLFGLWFSTGAASGGVDELPPTVVAADPEHAPLIGAALVATRGR